MIANRAMKLLPLFILYLLFAMDAEA
jgi:hypothetical protein